MKYGILIFGLCLFLVGCGGEDVTDTSTSEPANFTFQLRNIDQQLDRNRVDLNAEVNTTESEIYYTIEQGEELLHEETSIAIDEVSSWFPIDINYELAEAQISAEEPPIITVYVKDESGERTNPNYIPVDVK
ncbi:hypothetical protein [Oceanobacillus bengalensis]|uniref:Intracellular proteinase inhibitor BsuPI domain-containing protein n=1 Tax=Oceanobacillus bengalensis TaxID=1435466 RepID=A0A494Z8C5_9BACI|nr:hypothetical protein [Oceanobacillus bengalensis]RKQ18843.1 hypothetical protein D8M05_01675 [Oceanobacillus bengalensis]